MLNKIESFSNKTIKMMSHKKASEERWRLKEELELRIGNIQEQAVLAVKLERHWRIKEIGEEKLDFSPVRRSSEVTISSTTLRIIVSSEFITNLMNN